MLPANLIGRERGKRRQDESHTLSFPASHYLRNQGVIVGVRQLLGPSGSEEHKIVAVDPVTGTLLDETAGFVAGFPILSRGNMSPDGDWLGASPRLEQMVIRDAAGMLRVWKPGTPSPLSAPLMDAPSDFNVRQAGGAVAVEGAANGAVVMDTVGGAATLEVGQDGAPDRATLRPEVELLLPNGRGALFVRWLHADRSYGTGDIPVFDHQAVSARGCRTSFSSGWAISSEPPMWVGTLETGVDATWSWAVFGFDDDGRVLRLADLGEDATGFRNAQRIVVPGLTAW
ncbi:MAG: hypothetical protein AB2A00_41280 [Myxococcota bacterium]